MSDSAGPWNRIVPNWFSLVVIVVSVLLLLSLVFALITGGHPLELAYRNQCAANLKQIGEGCLEFDSGSGGRWPNAYGKDSEFWYKVGNTRTADGKADNGEPIQSNTASLWLLVKSGLCGNPAVFVCPSSDDERDIAAIDNTMVRDFRSERNCSYSYQNVLGPYRLNTSAPTTVALAADANPMRRYFWSGAPEGAEGRTDKELAKKPHLLVGDMSPVDGPWELNSPNHDFQGQNVLYADGHVEFWNHPYCGDKLDNIWLRRAAGSVTATGKEVPFNLAALRATNDTASYDGKATIPAGVRTDSFLMP